MSELPLDLPRTSKRGTRLPADWTPTPDLVEWCQSEYGLTLQQITDTADEFRDYWIAVPGQRGLKLNWSATFKNRIRVKFTKPGAQPADRSQYSQDQLRDIAAVVRKPWYTRGRYPPWVLDQCVRSDWLTKEEAEAAL